MKYLYIRLLTDNFSVLSRQENVTKIIDEFYIFYMVKKMFDAITAKVIA